MSRVLATILYEDSGPPQRYPPHQFVCACVADRLSRDIGSVLPLLDARPTNGVGELIKRVERCDQIARDGRCVVAVVDGDRIRRCLALPGDSSVDAVEAALRKRAPSQTQLQGFVIQRNLETVLQAIEECFESDDLKEKSRIARKKDPTARDLAFRMASKQEFNASRRCVLERVDGLARCVSFLADLLSASQT